MPGKKDAAYWAARRAEKKQKVADSGQLQRPPGRAPANMSWDCVHGWVKKEERATTVTNAAPDAAPAVSDAAPASEVLAGATLAAAPASAVTAAAPSSSVSNASVSTVDVQALNESHQAAALASSTAAATARVAAAKAGVALCGQCARVAVWAEDGSLGLATNSKLVEHEARCRAAAHAAWARRAAAVYRVTDRLGVRASSSCPRAARNFCMAAEAPLDVALREAAVDEQGWLLQLAQGLGADFERAFEEVEEQCQELAAPRRDQQVGAWAWRASKAARALHLEGAEPVCRSCSFTGLPRCPSGML